MNDFGNVYDLSDLVKEPRCFKNHDNLSCIYLFFNKSPKMSSKDYNNGKNELWSIDNNNSELLEFTNTFLSLLDKDASIKRKYIRANNSVFMTQGLRAAIMQRYKLIQKFLKQRANDSKHLYNRQRNLCVSLLQKRKRDK